MDRAEAYHNKDAQRLGYWSGEALQAVFGAEIIKGGASLVKGAQKAAEVAQKVAQSSEAAKVAKASQKVAQGGEAAQGVAKAAERIEKGAGTASALQRAEKEVQAVQQAKSVEGTAQVAKAAESVERAAEVEGVMKKMGETGKVDGTFIPNISKKAPELLSGQLTGENFLECAVKYLGEGYTEVSKGRFLSKDGLRQVRYDLHEVSSFVHHAHFEVYNTAGGQVIENARVVINP